MFILEESQLLDDTIQDKRVLKIYQTLRKYGEHSNQREPLVQHILSQDISITFFEAALELCQVHHFLPLNKGTTTDSIPRLEVDQRTQFCTRLGLQLTDAAPLVLVVSACLQQLFVIDNHVGPTSNLEAYDQLPDVFHRFKNLVDHRSLAVDGSDVYHLIKNAWLLKAAQLCWTILANLGCSRRLLDLEFLVWKHRFLTLHLMILLEPPESHIKELRKVQECIFDHHVINEARENKTQLTRFNLVELCCELAQAGLLIDGVSVARKFCDYASELSGITIEHTGVLGKRTKFQQNNVPQLVVKLKSPINNQATNNDEDNKTHSLPKDIRLEDDTLLPDVSLVSDEGAAVESLSSDAQLLMLTRLDLSLKCEVMEESLKDEWTLAYLRTLIKGATIWNLKFKALHMRSVVEKKNMRKMDRALLQMEELIKISGNQSETDNHSRLNSFYAILPLARWQMQKSLGDISMDMGLVKNALDLYKQIEYWEGIIKCLCLLDQTVKAEKVIRQELEKQETPYLLCLLGDVTDNIEHYEKSWELSKSRFSRSKKSIGTFYYVRKQYDEAIKHYELAVQANPSNISILSLLAYCCLTLERYDKAAEYYRHITNYDDGNFLAWNNLSKAYIKLGQKERAWRTLREAIKCNYEEWKIWENFMLVSIELDALDDVVTAWHRIIDIKGSHKDDQILSALTFALVKRSTSEYDADLTKLLTDTLKLLGRLVSTSDCSSRLWLCYFRLLMKEWDVSSSKAEFTHLDIDSRVSKIVNALQRATPKALAGDAELLKGSEKVDQILSVYDELADCYLIAKQTIGSRKELEHQWKSFQLSNQNLLKYLKMKGYETSRQQACSG